MKANVNSNDFPELLKFTSAFDEHIHDGTLKEFDEHLNLFFQPLALEEIYVWFSQFVGVGEIYVLQAS